MTHNGTSVNLKGACTNRADAFSLEFLSVEILNNVIFRLNSRDRLQD